MFFNCFLPQGLRCLSWLLCHFKDCGSRFTVLPQVPEYLAPAQEQGAIMIGVTGYPGTVAPYGIFQLNWTYCTI